jgi:hypothetical protein
MRNKHPRMRLSPEEESFLRQWIYDEAHYQEGTGPAKQLQLLKRATPAELSLLIAAAIPDPADQEAASLVTRPAESLTWPWSDEAFRSRVAEARAFLARRQGGQAGVIARNR